MPIFSNIDFAGDLTRVESLVPFRPWWLHRCQPRILIVTDGGLNYNPNDGFGLSRFIEAIAHHSSATLIPQITLAHRGSHSPSVSIASTNYPVTSNFNFATANPAVTTANYDQIWLFGILTQFSPINNNEIQVIANFMNNGGGVFATGDHASLGAGMCSQLPRIRHMRNWRSSGSGGVPMGNEALPLARERIDTVVNPGISNRYEFEDQSDDIPQRIYPNYAVTGAGFGSWTATIHPVLRMPGAAATRSPSDPSIGGNTFNGGLTTFSDDIDVLPDHPHESECFEVSGSSNAAALNGNYTVAGLNFPEFPNMASGSGKIGAEILAFSVSGGRSVWNSIWKPPVRPRMFGAISAFDGHLANPLAPGAARPGRIICDATWHHFVNINLDGIGSSRQGLGTWSGPNFTPSAALLKIYKYYQNMISWLQPSNRIWCNWLVLADLAVRRLSIAEELVDLQRLQADSDIAQIGRLMISAIDAVGGAGTALDLTRVSVREAKGPALASLLDPHLAGEAGIDLEQLLALTVGRTMAAILPQFPADGDPRYDETESDAHHALHKELETSLQQTVPDALVRAARLQTEALASRTKRARSVFAKALG